MLVKTVALFLLASMLQTQALPTKNEDSSSVNKLFSQELDVLDAEKLTSFIGENSEMLEELIPSIASILYKMTTGKTETIATILPHIDDVMACINITISLYDMEILLYQAYQFGLEVYDNGLHLGSDILECRNESSNVFEIIECSLDAVENSSSEFQDLWNRTIELVLDGETDFHQLTDNVKRCVGSS